LAISPPIKWISALAVLTAAVFGAALPLAAQQAPFVREMRLGVLGHDVPGIWSGFRLEHGTDINLELILSPSVQFLGGTIRPALGGSWNTEGYTSKIYADARWMIESRNGLFLGLGIGAAIHDGLLDPTELDRKALGRRVLFHFPLEIGYRFDAHNSLSLYFEHISNGYTTTHNEGLDSLGIRYGYKF
jgi:hypothetical protein